MNVNMASAIREISVQRGYDPRDFLMVCAGGAGPIHAAELAKELEITRILVPKESSIFCAAGMLLSDLKHDSVRSYHCLFNKKSLDRSFFLALLAEMEEEGERTLAGEGIPPERRRFEHSLDLRYVGQYHEVNVGLAAEVIKGLDLEAIQRAFHAAHNRLYGYDLEKEGTGLELVNIRQTAKGLTDKPVLQKETFRGENPASARKGERPVFIPEEGNYQPVPVYDGQALGYGNRLKGPAIVEQVNTTIFVPPQYELRCDEYGSYLLTLT